MLKKFRWIDDVESWLNPMGYEEFWRQIDPYHLPMHKRASCDAQIASGVATRDDVLFGLKSVACYVLTRRHRLERKPATPWLKVVAAREE